jgi:hypothetical protein
MRFKRVDACIPRQPHLTDDADALIATALACSGLFRRGVGRYCSHRVGYRCRSIVDHPAIVAQYSMVMSDILSAVTPFGAQCLRIYLHQQRKDKSLRVVHLRMWRFSRFYTRHDDGLLLFSYRQLR